MPRTEKIRGLMIGVILAAGFLAYGPTLTVGFLWDDHEIIEKNPTIKTVSLQNIRHAFTSDLFDQKGDAYYRPLQTLSNMLDYQIWGERPFGFHLTNLLFHLLSAVLLFFLTAEVFKSQWGGLWAGMLFAVHPIGVEQLLIIAGRAEIMSFTFVLLTVYFGRRRDEKSQGLAVLFYAFACLSKETGIVAPFFLALVQWKENRKIKVRPCLIFAAIGVVYLALRHHAVPSSEIFPGVRPSLIFVFRDLPAIVVEYTRIIVLPYDLHSHRRMDFSLPSILFSWLILVVVLYFVYRRKNKLIVFSLIWFFIGLLPKMPLLASNSLMLDHWAYPSAAGVFILLGVTAGKRKAAAILALFFGAVTLFYIQHRNTDRKMYEWAMRYPSSSIVRYNLGVLEYQEGNYPKADELFRRSYSMNPDQPMFASGMASNLTKMGQENEAMRWLNEWIDRYPDYFLTYYTRARLTEGEESLRDLERSLSLNPTFEDAVFLKGVRFLQLKRYEPARETFQALVDLNPHHVDANLNLGTAYALLGDREKARHTWMRTLELDPDNEKALRNLN